MGAEVLVAFGGPNGLSIRQDGVKFGVFLGASALDWFANYQDARRLTQDLSISRLASANDVLLGQVKYCSDAITSGKTVIVIAKVKSGYMVQTIGTQERFEVAEAELSEPPTYFS